MSRRKISLSKDILEKMYWTENLSPYKIGDIFGCSFSTITNRMREFGIKFKNHSLARQKYPRSNFSDDILEKSYMFGFRVGDLSVYKTNPRSEFIVVRCHTTTVDQVKVLEKMFGKYGRVTVSLSGDNNFHINCFLNDSFTFLLGKYPDMSQFTGAEQIYAFIAGYSDAEGYFGINQGKARFKIDSYDEVVMKWIGDNLARLGIRNIVKIISICRDKRNFGAKLYRLNVNYGADLLKLIDNIKKYCLHKTRINQMRICRKNIVKRIENGSI
ncbi:MAG: LAGLIDADG family homing endonuclease [Candidatus Berkelbacteria bacterium]